MMNSEIATAVMMGVRLTLVVIDNRGFGCIHRLQNATGGEGFNNRLEDSHHTVLPDIDFVLHARALGAHAEKAGDIAAFETAITAARARGGVNVVVIDTEAVPGTAIGGTWWDVAVPEVSDSPRVKSARAAYDQKLDSIKDQTA
jgi:3D-(3,5/4)-trihydroxycyclohexane-1,2-dione acylhydrolase (decyclizing)